MSRHDHSASTVTLFLCGDVMLGRGIDQILAPGRSASRRALCQIGDDLCRACGTVNGPIPRTVDYAYVWGDALSDWIAEAPDRGSSISRPASPTAMTLAPKGINYKMNPANIGCLAAAR